MKFDVSGRNSTHFNQKVIRKVFQDRCVSVMNRLEHSGVLSAVNAFALHDNGRFAYLFDPRVNATIRLDLNTGTRDVLKWTSETKELRGNMECRCDEPFDSVFAQLEQYHENTISIEPIRSERLAYNAHKDEHKLHIIFYDRFTRHSDHLDDQSPSLSFVYCSFNCQTLRLSTRKGFLPPGQWELPFTAHEDASLNSPFHENPLKSLHFISTEHTTTQLASMPIDADGSTGTWNIRAVLPDNNDTHPPRKAVWCNAWRIGMAWYVLCEKNVTELEITRMITIWQLDVLDCRWRKLPVEIAAPVTAANFAVRIDLNNVAYLHCDWERDAVFHTFGLNELMSQRQDAPLATIEEEEEEECELSPVSQDGNPEFLALSSTEIICPICLDTYDDPRTLSCGHSICNNCVEQMKATAQNNTIRCCACRKATTIPPAGLPVNFGLRDAIETLERARQLSLSNLRCGRCRTHCEESGMWICLKCCQEQAVAETSFSSSKEDNSGSPEDNVDAATVMTKRYSFCASCILKYHSDHRIDELSKFRERWKYAKEKNLKCMERVSQILKNLKVSFMKQLEPTIIQPLRNDVANDLLEACDAVVNGTQLISSEADEAIVKFESRVSTLIENIAANLKAILDKSSSTANYSDRPTQL
uniref:RING-type domain-containing protein n=1 Tax=Ascaris lumbricoides TaxID=6252 RepID=A0A9J2PJ70_ASCLU